MREGGRWVLLILLLGMPALCRAQYVEAIINIAGAWTSMTTSSLALAGLPAYVELLITDESSLTVAATTCLAGSYSNDDAQTCTACPAGKYSSTVTATSGNTCVSCESGKYSTVIGASASSTCTDCPISTYFESTAGASLAVCLACPGNSSSYQGSKLLQACVCNPGWAGPNGGTCLACNTSVWCLYGQSNPCPSNSKSAATSSSLAQCLCRGGYYGDTTMGGPDLTLCQASPRRTTHAHTGFRDSCLIALRRGGRGR